MSVLEPRDRAGRSPVGRALKAAALSGLVFPGLGQLYNRQRAKGVAFIGLTGLAFVVICVDLVALVLRVMPADPTAYDPEQIAALVHENLTHGGGRLSAFVLLLVAAWAGSAIDAALVAWRLPPVPRARAEATSVSTRATPPRDAGHAASVVRGANDPRASGIRLSGDALVVSLRDGRSVSVPLAWFPRLQEASESGRHGWELLEDGRRIRWRALDLDVAVAALLGAPDPNSGPSG
jgi:hypothetical protein